MKNLLRIGALLLLLVAPAALQAASFVIGNGDFRVTVEGPCGQDWAGTEAARFDRTGRVSSILMDGREWLTGEGLVDEFNPRWIAPPGYDAAMPGGRYLKIGLGLVERRKVTPYRFWENHVVAKSPDWRLVAQTDTTVSFEQTLVGEGWGYRLKKAYEVFPESRLLEISYELENTGFQSLGIDQYNHNWLKAASLTREDPLVVTMPLGLPVDWLRFFPVALQGILLDAETGPAFATVRAKESGGANRVVLQQGADGVEITGDFPISRLSLFVSGQAVCPEIFFQKEIPPGDVANWRRSYRFYRTVSLPGVSRYVLR